MKVYLDHNATTPCSERALGAMGGFHTDGFGNPSSKHWAGRLARKGVEKGRQQVAELMGCRPSQVIFTGGGTEADNIALNGAVHRMRKKGRHVVSTPLEHPAVLGPLQRMADLGVIDLTLLSVDEHGRVDLEELQSELRDDTVIVAIMAAHNELGTVYPFTEIATLCGEAGAHYHCDGVQATGKIPLQTVSAGIDTFAVSAHKLYGPKGIGCLVAANPDGLEPLMVGGGQERGLRSGTENVPGIVGFGVACAEARATMKDEGPRLDGLRRTLLAGLQEIFPEMVVNTPLDESLPNTLHVSVRGLDAVAMLAELDAVGVAASAGSACHAGGGGSSALRHIGLDSNALHGTLRLSLGRSSSEESTEYVLAAFRERYKAAMER